MSKIIVSGTAKGKGSDCFRYVSGLSKEAKQALSDKSALVVCDRPISDNQGDYYVVTENRGRYGHRLPNAQEKQLLNEM